MPKYLVEMHDGRKFQVEADSPPSEAEVLAHLGDQSAPSATAADMLTGRRVTSDAPGEPPLSGAVSALQPLAHPQGAGDMAALLLPRPLGEALNLGTSAMQSGLKAHPEMTGVIGRLKAGVLGIGERWRGSQPLSAEERATVGTVGKAPTTAPSVTVQPPTSDVWDRALSDARTAPAATAAAPAAQTAGPTTSGLSTAERAQLAKQNYAPETIAKIERAQAAQSPATGRLAVNPDLQQPRIATGAEKVGREMGLSKEQVRQQTNPILGEAPGEASPIFPRETLGKIVDAVKALPVSEREAYVAKATSGKAQWQIENIRRTLEHLGLMVPAAIGIEPAVRERLQSLMHSGSQ